MAAFICAMVVAEAIGVGLMFAWIGLSPVAAIAPGAVIMEFMRMNYKDHVVRCQMIITFFECVLWMIGLFVILLGLGAIPIYPFHIDESDRTGDCSRCIGGYAFTSYFLAGTLEEVVKYLAIRRIVYHSTVADPRALWVYGACAGAGFATVENVLYVLGGGVSTALLRAVLAVPLHCCTGIMMGLSLSQMRFGQFENRVPTTTIAHFLRELLYSPPMVLLPCIIVHGTYDFALFTGQGVGGDLQWLMVISVALIVITPTVIRWRMVMLENALPSGPRTIHEMIESGEVIRPCMCCMCADFCY